MLQFLYWQLWVLQMNAFNKKTRKQEQPQHQYEIATTFQIAPAVMFLLKRSEANCILRKYQFMCIIKSVKLLRSQIVQRNLCPWNAINSCNMNPLRLNSGSSGKNDFHMNSWIWLVWQIENPRCLMWYDFMKKCNKAGQAWQKLMLHEIKHYATYAHKDQYCFGWLFNCITLVKVNNHLSSANKTIMLQ